MCLSPAELAVFGTLGGVAITAIATVFTRERIECQGYTFHKMRFQLTAGGNSGGRWEFWAEFWGHHTCAAGQGRVIQRVGIPPRKAGQPPGSESLEG
jgi:hypothetical protein